MTGLKIVVLTTTAAVVLSVRQAFACAVCFADPESSIAQGTIWGVAVLLGVVSTVLASIAGMIVFWARRARQLEAAGGSVGVQAPELRSS